MAVEFGVTILIHYNDLYLLRRILSHTDFTDAMARQVRPTRRNNRGTVGMLFLGLLLLITFELATIDTARRFQVNGVLPYLNGPPCDPNTSTLRPFVLCLVLVALPDLRRFQD